MKVLWSEEQQTLYVDGYQISGKFLEALVKEEISTQPWRVMRRERGMITMQAHVCLDLEKIKLPERPEPVEKVLSWFGFETMASVVRRAAYNARMVMWLDWRIALGLP